MARYNIPNLYIANRERSVSGGSSAEVEARLDALEGKEPLASVTADGVKSYAQLFEDLIALLPSGAHPKTLVASGFYMVLSYFSESENRYYTMFSSGSGKLYIRAARLKHGDTEHVFDEWELGQSGTDKSSTVPTSGDIISAYEY